MRHIVSLIVLTQYIHTQLESVAKISNLQRIAFQYIEAHQYIEAYQYVVLKYIEPYQYIANYLFLQRTLTAYP